MGSSYWSNDFYAEREVVRKKENKSAFEYNAVVAKAPVHERKVHEKLLPFRIRRESRDSAAHPESVAIGVIFDVTGSMHQVPITLQKRLPALMTTLIGRNYVKDPQILMGAIGDATCDAGSLQIGQFESGIEMDDDLGRMWLEKGGGGGYEESYQNAIYFFARHTSCDCFEKRGKKGYLFLMGDEMPYPTVSRVEIQRLLGDDLQADIPIANIIKEAQERWNIFFIIPGGTTHGDDPKLYNRWAELLGGQNVLRLASADAVCETITMTVGLCEGAVNLDKAQDDMQSAGSGTSHVQTAAAALNSLAKTKGKASRTTRL